ncbi:PadR family transcriptional regulator [Clostridia bacterium OttesenSCG-928-F22]|nr:PadR family transcriptional regulator [Clostridia bacterium OttesenSCG-928-F22]
MEACVLSALQRNDSYGYRLIKEISPYIELSESTLYPVLKRLEAGQYLEVYTVEYNGRLRKYYRITDKGRARIADFLNEWEDVVKVYQFIKGGQGDDEK